MHKRNSIVALLVPTLLSASTSILFASTLADSVGASCEFLTSKVVFRPGTSSPSVRDLQMLLNLDPATQVTVSGLGSLDLETDYFGGSTRQALIRFQEKYKNEILTPRGLTKGTGFMGASTRVKLRSLYCATTTKSISPQSSTPTVMDSSSTSSGNVLLFDLVSQVKPTVASKTLYVFSDKEFNQACRIDYWLESGVVKHKQSMVYTPEIVRPIFKSAPVSISTWYSSVPLCSSEMVVNVNSKNQLVIAARGPSGKFAHSVAFSSESVLMRERSPEVMAKVFKGIEAFRSIAGTEASDAGLKLNQYLTFKFNEFFLKDYSKLQFVLDVMPLAINVRTNCVPVVPNDPRAQKCYDSNKHGSQFRMSLGNMTWKDPRCTKKVDSDPVCRYYGDFLYLSLQLYDERREFFDDDEAFFLDPGTGSYIYRVNMRKFLPSGTTENPLKKVGQRTVLNGDLLIDIKSAVIEAEKLGYLPPRLVVRETGKPESDAQYIAHFSMSSSNLGYEVSGLSGITYQIDQFKFTGVRVASSTMADHSPVTGSAVASAVPAF